MSIQQRPNILMLTMDTQRVSNLSCYGYPLQTTPHLSKFAQKATLFKNVISPGTWTLPSHASVFTGRYVCGHGADMHHLRLEKDFPTLAEILTSVGYETMTFGSTMWVGDYDGCARGFNVVGAKSNRFKTRAEEDAYIAEQLKQRGEEHDKKDSLQNTLRAIDYMEKAKKKNQPFFYYIRYLESHLPYWPSNPYRNQFLLKEISKEYGWFLQDEYVRRRHAQEVLPVLARKRVYSKEEWAVLRRLYDGATATLDARLQVIFDYLESSGLQENTIVIIWADHGDEIGEHFPFVGHSACIYNTIVKVPLIVRYPGMFPEGKTVDTIVQTHDIFPTILEILGIDDEKYWKNVQSQSLLPIIKGEPGRGFAVAEGFRPLGAIGGILNQNPDVDIRFFNRDLKCICCNGYKYIWSSNGMDELYHVDSDPDEQNNLIHNQPEIAQDLYKRLKDFLLSIEQVDYGDLLIRSVPTKENLKFLKAFGFLRARPDNLPKMYPEAHKLNYPYGL